MNKGPYHVVHRKHNGQHVGYDIYMDNQVFLRGCPCRQRGHLTRGPRSWRLLRPEAYAIAALLNGETRSRKWAAKFSDPY